jgi:hypothetical protein
VLRRQPLDIRAELRKNRAQKHQQVEAMKKDFASATPLSKPIAGTD